MFDWGWETWEVWWYERVNNINKYKTETKKRDHSSTRYASAESDEGNSIDTIFKVDEAAEMASNVADYGSD